MRILSSIIILACSAPLWAQRPLVEPDSIALVDDKFQELFYESLKQKGIENYDRAIVLLQQAQELKPQDAVLFHEIGKNYLNQKKYAQAEDYFLKALATDPGNKWFNLSLYDVYYQSKNYQKSIDVVKKLIALNDRRKIEFQDDLVSLYIYTNQKDKALALIEELEQTAPPDMGRQMYKMQILQEQASQNAQASEEQLKAKIRQNPKDEQAYIALIYYYSERGSDEKSFALAQQLAQELPNSEWAHVSLFKFYLDQGQIPQAIASMNKALESQKIDLKIKHRIVNEFLIFTNANPQYLSDLVTAQKYLKDDKSIQVSKEIAKYFFAKENWQAAQKFYELSLEEYPEDIEALVYYFQCLHRQQLHEKMLADSKTYLLKFPLQPQIYLYQGLAYNYLKQPAQAKGVLQEGLDYIIDDLPLEIDLYNQLIYSSKLLQEDASKYERKVQELTKKVQK